MPLICGSRIGFPGVDANLIWRSPSLASKALGHAPAAPTARIRALPTKTAWVSPNWRRCPQAEQYPELQAMIGELFMRATAVKLDEFEEFNRVISSWEREHLLLQV